MAGTVDTDRSLTRSRTLHRLRFEFERHRRIGGLHGSGGGVLGRGVHRDHGFMAGSQSRHHGGVGDELLRGPVRQERAGYSDPRRQRASRGCTARRNCKRVVRR